MIDTHCHLEKKEYENLEQVIKNMQNNIMITSGVDLESNIEAIDLANKYENIYCTIGIHPEYASLPNSQLKKAYEHIENNIKNKKVVGIGEIGLDYHYPCDIQAQKELFIMQLDLAVKYNKTVVIHSRDAVKDTYDILKKYKKLKKVIHCYSSSVEMAKEFIKINSMLGIGGVLTFKNSQKLKEVVSNIDINYLLLETDSPYLSPEPLRGNKNEPFNVKYVADKMAQIKGLKTEEILEKTTKNAIYQFDLNVNL